MRLLDLCCGAGGASMGYSRAGFEVVGIDIRPQPHYPFEFIQLDLYKEFPDLSTFDVIHASPPCQEFTVANGLRSGIYSPIDRKKRDLLPLVEEMLVNSGKPFVIENVPNAPLQGRIIQLCGSSFGLGVRRHRWFASNLFLRKELCRHGQQGKPIGVYYTMNYQIYKGGKTASTLEEAQRAMGIDWMNWNEIKEAIPPIYTEFLGKQILNQLDAKVVCELES